MTNHRLSEGRIISDSSPLVFKERWEEERERESENDRERERGRENDRVSE